MIDKVSNSSNSLGLKKDNNIITFEQFVKMLNNNQVDKLDLF
ncbi:MAG: hypothetical protein KatS3mg068_2108 [Candidatus Sericytochromatia bacterium]|nr:MAG: hypothetical protein KatS3mg068_2108 [Candidatus Sericytochromatia bacterium]